MKKHICPMCGEPLKKGSTAYSCGYKESLADRELLRRLAVWSRVQTLGTVLLVLGFLVSVTFYRCPHCHRVLPANRGKMDDCPYCKLPLRDTK